MLEEFYQDVYPKIIYKWVLSNYQKYLKNSATLSIETTPDNDYTIIFHMKHVQGRISIWSMHIIEEEIINLDTQEQLFYLHYSIANLNQCHHLCIEFYHSLNKYNHTFSCFIGLCCTGGLSTAVFVEQMKEICQLENIQFTLESLSLDQIPQSYEKYEALYLAPQIAYLEPQIMQMTHNQVHIYRLNPSDFATKNYHSIIKTIQSNLTHQ